MGTHAAIIGRLKGKVHFILHLQFDGFLEQAGKILMEFLVSHPPTHTNVETLFARIIALFASSEGARVYLEDPNQKHPGQEFTYTIDFDDVNPREFFIRIEHSSVLFQGKVTDALEQLPKLIEMDKMSDWWDDHINACTICGCDDCRECTLCTDVVTDQYKREIADEDDLASSSKKQKSI